MERSVAPALNAFPLTVTDDTGVELTLEARPERVVAVLPSVVDLIADLGLVDRLVGVDDFSLAKAPQAVSVGGNNFTFNIEVIAELQPDLILVAVGGTEELVQQSRALGFPVYAMAYPDRLATMLEQLRTIGRLLGDQAAGETLAEDLGERLAAVSRRVAAGAGAQRASTSRSISRRRRSRSAWDRGRCIRRSSSWRGAPTSSRGRRARSRRSTGRASSPPTRR